MSPIWIFFEDTALSLALAKWGRPAIAPGKVITSARRFCDRGIYRQAALNQLLKLMYLTRQDPKRLNWLYERKKPNKCKLRQNTAKIGVAKMDIAKMDIDSK